MNNTLLTAGLVCTIAAIIGGGLKAFGIEIPVLQSTARQCLLGGLGLILIFITFREQLPSLPDTPSTPVSTISGELNHPSSEFTPVEGSSAGADADMAYQLAMDAKAAAERVEAAADDSYSLYDPAFFTVAVGVARSDADRAAAIAGRLASGDNKAAQSKAEQAAADAKASADRAEAVAKQYNHASNTE
jgi:hypothetical protein